MRCWYRSVCSGRENGWRQCLWSMWLYNKRESEYLGNTNHWLRCHHLRYRSTRLTKHRWYSAQAQCSPHWWYQCDTPDRPNRTTRSHRPRTSGIAFHATRSFWSHRSGRPLDRYVSATGSAAVITTISGFIIWTVHNKIPCIKFVVAYILCRSAAYEKNTAK